MRHVWKHDPAWDESIWRYFKTKRFVELLESSRIHFAAAHQFEDPFEGCVAVQSPEYRVDPRYAEMEHTERAFKQLTRLTKISCWHRADFESDAMWKLYAGFSKGVAVQTTMKKLIKSLQPFRLSENYAEEDLWGGDIQYKDLTHVRLKPSSMERFFYKHQAFAWEREFRLAISVRMAEEYGVRVPCNGIYVGIQCDAMIDRVILGPSLSTKERQAITNAATTAGIADRLETSTLLFNPRYI